MSSEYVGLLPCAGKAERMMGLPKFLLPVGDTYLLKWHVRQMMATVATVISIPNPENRALLQEYLGWIDIIAPAVETLTFCETLCQVRPLCGSQQVVMSLPDTFVNGDARDNLPDLQEALDRHPDWDAAVLAFELNPWQVGRLGLLELDDKHLIQRVHDKDATRTTGLIWGAAAWRTSFWKHIKPEHKHLGIAFETARTGMVRGRGTFYDCGTPEEYYRLCAYFHEERGPSVSLLTASVSYQHRPDSDQTEEPDYD